MSTTKFTPKSVIPTMQSLGEPIIDQRPGTAPSPSITFNKPTITSIQKMTRSAIEPFVAPVGARCRASSLTPYGENLNALAAQALPALLGVDPSSTPAAGYLSRKLLEQAIAVPLRAKDIRALPATWPPELVSGAMVTAWTSRLVAACDHVYTERGMQAYIEAVTDLIFDEGNQDAGLPDGIRHFCAMLTKNALEVGLAQGLDRRALQGLRNTVVIRFLMGSVFIPHLRPTSLRESTDDATLYSFDRQLFKRFCHKTTEIIDIDAEAIALLAASRQARRAAPTAQA